MLKDSIVGRKMCAVLFAALGLGFAGAAAEAAPVVMISIDGMRPDTITQADAHRLKVPNLRRFVTEGAYAEGVTGIYPTITYASHTTLVTGVDPAVHGIYNNGAFDPTGDGEANVWGRDIKAETLWQAASKARLKTASVHWPVTIDADGITYNIPQYKNSITHSDIRLMEAISRPPGYLQQLEDKLGPFQSGDALDADRLYAKFAEAIVRDQRPRFMTVHFSDLDHVQHAVGIFKPEGAKAIEALDGLVGDLMKAALAVDRSTVFVVVSDHGFADVNSGVNLLGDFVDAGFIKLSDPDASGQRHFVDWQASVYDGGGSAAIYLKNPDDAAVKDRVRALLTSLQTPDGGIDRILEGDAVKATGGFPGATFLVNYRHGFEGFGTLDGARKEHYDGGGEHGYFPDVPDMRSSFFVLGANLPVHGDLGVIDMKAIAPTVAGLLGAPFHQGLPPVFKPR